MTGFGRGEVSAGTWAVAVEIASVNRKQLDVVVAGPPFALAEESAIRAEISQSVARGRVSARVDCRRSSGAGKQLSFDADLAREYLAALRPLCHAEGLALEEIASGLWRAPGLFSLEEAPPAGDESLRAALFEALRLAVQGLVAMEESEGAHLRSDLESRLEVLERHAAEIARLAPEVAPRYRSQLQRRLAEAGLTVDLDDERVLREIALFADRCDVSEELVRLESHTAQFRRYLAGDEAAGRPLDFLCQELHRELNTIGSKANHAEIARCVVAAKSELEKLREQVQNLQ